MAPLVDGWDYGSWSAVYNALSFVMASMGASTIYFFFHSQLVKPRFKTALCVSALVTPCRRSKIC